MNPPNIPIGSLSHSSCVSSMESGEKIGMFRSFSHSTAASAWPMTMRPCAKWMTASGPISRRNVRRWRCDETG